MPLIPRQRFGFIRRSLVGSQLRKRRSPSTLFLQSRNGTTPCRPSLRYFSSTVLDATSVTEKDDIKGEKFYEGAFSDVLVKIKLVSLLSCSSTLIGVPLLTIYGNPEVPLTARIGMGAVCVFFGVGTTTALHFVSKPYSLKMWYNKDTERYTSESLTFFAQRDYTSFAINEIAPPAAGGLFTSFSVMDQVNSVPLKNVFVHMNEQMWDGSSHGKQLHRQISTFAPVESEEPSAEGGSSQDPSPGSNGPAVTECKTEEEFDTLIQGRVIVDFTATWCGPCKMIGPVFNELGEKHQSNPHGTKFTKVDVDELSEVAMKAGIQVMPTFQVWENGEKVEEFAGASAEKLEALFEEYC